ncbi:hypothetical protein ACCO45_001539 [Purpureocillium lilacinum]|uniref:Uncharacterized protein n=1 Tax=Purpureocillium lilacinum TaxID=33203 RepID=A0ACC4EA27_PURLI
MASASKAAAKKLVVCGGSGFLGSRICKYAVARGWDVTSISLQPLGRAQVGKCHRLRRNALVVSQGLVGARRHPPPRHLCAAAQGRRLRCPQHGYPPRGRLQGHRLRQGLAHRRPAEDLRLTRCTAARRQPLDKKLGEDIKPEDPNLQFSYEVMNRDSAVALARHASDEGTGAFCYISACGGAPIMPPRYISTKREAESAIATNFPRMRNVFFRPPFMYDGSRKFTVGMAAMAGAGTIFNNLTGKYLNNFMGAAGTKPLKVEVVAEAVVEALSDEKVQGPVEVEEIEELANKAWRKSML